MRKTILGLAMASCLLGRPLAARAEAPGNEILFSSLAAVANLFYTPAKVVVATVGLPVGAVAGFLNGGDTRAAYAFWVPAAGGNYFLTADQMDGVEPVRFFGDDYADRPARYGHTANGSTVYDAIYEHR